MFELVEEAFDEVAVLVEFGIDRTLDLGVAAGRSAQPCAGREVPAVASAATTRLCRRGSAGPPNCIDNVVAFPLVLGMEHKKIATPRAIQAERRRGAVRKDDVIQIRASAVTKSILNRAATLRGQKLSEFMLDSARRQAEETILDQRTFFLDPGAHAKFLAILDRPPKPSAELRARMRRKPSWEN